MAKKCFSIILPIYKNELNLPVTVPYIMERLSLFPDYTVELIMVNDGSPDKSWQIMKELQQQYPETIRIASFTKNNGQRAGVNCGMQMARGDVIGVISADLQDPFELFVDMLKEWEQGEKLVIAYREKREEQNVSSSFSRMLHHFIRKNINEAYPDGGFDFFLLDRSLAKEFVKADTRNNSMQLLLLDLYSHPKMIGYTRKKRELGKSGWTTWRKIDQVVNIFAVYSINPFVLFLKTGIVSGILGAVLLIASLIMLIWNISIASYLAIWAVGAILGAILLAIGSILGMYLFKFSQNASRVPRFVIDEMIDESTGREEQ